MESDRPGFQPQLHHHCRCHHRQVTETRQLMLRTLQTHGSSKRRRGPAPQMEEMAPMLDFGSGKEPGCGRYTRETPHTLIARGKAPDPASSSMDLAVCQDALPRHLWASGAAVMLGLLPPCYSGHQPCTQCPPVGPRHHLVSLCRPQAPSGT